MSEPSAGTESEGSAYLPITQHLRLVAYKLDNEKASMEQLLMGAYYRLDPAHDYSRSTKQEPVLRQLNKKLFRRTTP
jgi:hypothetical protein